MALWREEPVWNLGERRNERVGSVGVDVLFHGPARRVAVHRPSRGPRAAERRPEARELSLPVGPDVVLLSYR